MSRLILVQQQKGGEWKTTTSIHLAYYLKGLGHEFHLGCLEREDRTLALLDPAWITYPPDEKELLEGHPRARALAKRMRSLAANHGNLLIDCGGSSIGYWDYLFQLEPLLLEELRKAGVKITRIVPTSNHVDARRFFTEHDHIFDAASTKILAVQGIDGHMERGTPPYPVELTLGIPQMPKRLVNATLEMGKPAGRITEEDAAEFGFPIGFARNADKAFASAFNHILDYLKP